MWSVSKKQVNNKNELRIQYASESKARESIADVGNLQMQSLAF